MSAWKAVRRESGGVRVLCQPPYFVGLAHWQSISERQPLMVTILCARAERQYHWPKRQEAQSLHPTPNFLSITPFFLTSIQSSVSLHPCKYFAHTLTFRNLSPHLTLSDQVIKSTANVSLSFVGAGPITHALKFGPIINTPSPYILSLVWTSQISVGVIILIIELPSKNIFFQVPTPVSLPFGATSHFTPPTEAIFSEKTQSGILSLTGQKPPDLDYIWVKSP